EGLREYAQSEHLAQGREGLHARIDIVDARELQQRVSECFEASEIVIEGERRELSDLRTRESAAVRQPKLELLRRRVNQLHSRQDVHVVQSRFAVARGIDAQLTYCPRC